jgi:glucosamine 6-phosphate synthetase-like amidotransferase/phosphosugar isomerase protein
MVTVQRPVKELDATVSNASKGEYKHYMLKEIYEQPEAFNKPFLKHSMAMHYVKISC